MIKDIITKTVQYSRRYACLCVFSVMGCGSNQLGAHKRDPVDLKQQRSLKKEAQRYYDNQKYVNRTSQRIQMLNEEAQWGLEQAPPLGLIDFQRMLHRAPQSTTSRIVGGRGGLVSLLFLTLYFSNVQGNIGVSVPCDMMQVQLPITLRQDINVESYLNQKIDKERCIQYLDKVLEKVETIAQSAALVKYNRIPDGTNNALKYKIFKNHNGRNETYVMEEYKKVCSHVENKTICTIRTDYISPLDIIEEIINSSLSQEDKIKKVENLVVKMLSGQEQADLRSWCSIPTLVKPAYYIIELAEQFYDWAKLKQSEVTDKSKLEDCRRKEGNLREQIQKLNVKPSDCKRETTDYQSSSYNLRENFERSQGDGQNKSPIGSEQQQVETCEGTCLIRSNIQRLNQCLQKKTNSGIKELLSVAKEHEHNTLQQEIENCFVKNEHGETEKFLHSCHPKLRRLRNFVNELFNMVKSGSEKFFKEDGGYLDVCLNELSSENSTAS